MDRLDAPPTPLTRGQLLTETVLVLGVSLGASAIWSVLSIIRKLTEPTALGDQVTAMNTSTTADRPWLDLVYQLVGIGVALVPAALALHLLTREDSRARLRIGFDFARPGRDLVWGLGVAALIGIPGLGLYAAARALDLNTTIAAANLGEAWWTVPILVLLALKNALLEQIIMIGYLFTRWTQAGWGTTRIILTSAAIRGTYHLYQGFGALVGNFIMAVVFGWFYARTRRLGPLIVAHTTIDIVAFVGYALLRDQLSWL